MLTLLNSPGILRQSAKLHAQLVSTLTEKIGANNFTTEMFLQPFPSYLSKLAQQNGGNMLGLDRLTSNAIFWVAGVAIQNGDDAALAFAQAELSKMTSKLQEFASKDNSTMKLVYLNYADASQDPLGSYGPVNLAFMKDVASRYDPDGFWQHRVPGGFKLSRATAQ
jgi:hypothetical protein